MFALLVALIAAAGSALRSRASLAVENLALRQQLAVLRRRRPRPPLAWTDRLFWIALSRTWSRWRSALAIVHPDTVVRWHHDAFRRFWTWRSRRAPGRPPIDRCTRDLVRQMAQANPLWGAPRIHGELLKLGIGVSEREVSRLIPRAPRKPPSQTWRTFLTNHVGTLSSINFFTVPTATFRVLYVFLVLAHDRRRVLHFNVTEHPTAPWTAQQIVPARLVNLFSGDERCPGLRGSRRGQGSLAPILYPPWGSIEFWRTTGPRRRPPVTGWSRSAAPEPATVLPATTRASAGSRSTYAHSPRTIDPPTVCSRSVTFIPSTLLLQKEFAYCRTTRIGPQYG